MKSLKSFSTSASLQRMKNWYSSKGEVLKEESQTALPADFPNLSPASFVTRGIVKPAERNCITSWLPDLCSFGRYTNQILLLIPFY